MNQNRHPTEEQLVFFRNTTNKIEEKLQSVICGQDKLIRQLQLAIFAGGHVLLEGLPGLGKTQLVKVLARSLNIPLSRIQCTPDLMPADITGSEVLFPDSNKERLLEFRHGPIFSNLVLVDEINRATPKTQAALLEAMAEKQVTYGGKTYRLPEPNWIIATQNPIELEGTYPLPEAQLDRFIAKILVEFPDHNALIRMIDISIDNEPASTVEPILSDDELGSLLQTPKQVIIAQPIKQAAVDLILATHGDHQSGSNVAKQYFRYGASPRGLQALLKMARINSLAEGRIHVSIEDLEQVALITLRHRILLNLESEMQGISVDSLLTQIIHEWRKVH